MSGTITRTKIPTLKAKNNTANSNKEKANVLAQHFVNISSTNNYSDTFKKHKKEFEKDNKDICQNTRCLEIINYNTYIKIRQIF